MTVEMAAAAAVISIAEIKLLQGMSCTYSTVSLTVTKVALNRLFQFVAFNPSTTFRFKNNIRCKIGARHRTTKHRCATVGHCCSNDGNGVFATARQTTATRAVETDVSSVKVCNIPFMDTIHHYDFPYVGLKINDDVLQMKIVFGLMRGSPINDAISIHKSVDL